MARTICYFAIDKHSDIGTSVLNTKNEICYNNKSNNFARVKIENFNNDVKNEFSCSTSAEDNFHVTVKQETSITTPLSGEGEIKDETRDISLDNSDIKSEPVDGYESNKRKEQLMEICVPPFKPENYFYEENMGYDDSIFNDFANEAIPDFSVGQTVSIEWENDGYGKELDCLNNVLDVNDKTTKEERKIGDLSDEPTKKFTPRPSRPLKIHKVVYSEKKDHKSSKKFSRSSHSKRHKRIEFKSRKELEHGLAKQKHDKINKCNVCLKTFSSAGTLNRHKLLHDNEKPYECNLCNMRFSQSGHLQRHSEIHSGIKTFSCTYCDKQFRTSANLQRHLLTHMDDKKYACDLCDKKYTEITSLKTHRLAAHSDHKPFQCDICLKNLSDGKALRRHKLIHSDTKAFTCDICHKDFRLSGTLKRHKVLIHESKKSSND